MITINDQRFRFAFLAKGQIAKNMAPKIKKTSELNNMQSTQEIVQLYVANLIIFKYSP